MAMGMVAGTTMAMSAGERRRGEEKKIQSWSEPFCRLFCFVFFRSLRDLVDDPFASARRPPPSHDANVSDPWHAQLQLRAPAVVNGGQHE